MAVAPKKKINTINLPLTMSMAANNKKKTIDVYMDLMCVKSFNMIKYFMAI